MAPVAWMAILAVALMASPVVVHGSMAPSQPSSPRATLGLSNDGAHAVGSITRLPNTGAPIEPTPLRENDRVPSTSPSISSTLVLINNTLEPSTFISNESSPSDTPLVYDSSRGQVLDGPDFISDSTNRVVRNLPPGEKGYGPAYDSTQGELFFAAQNTLAGWGSVMVVSDSSFAILAYVHVGLYPMAPVYDAGQGEVFVPNSYTNNITVISTSTNQATANIGVGHSPWAAVYDSGKGEVFTMNYGSDNVSIISDTTNKVVATVPVGAEPYRAAYDSAKGEVFVVNTLSGNISVISDATNTVVATIPLPGTQNGDGIAYDGGTGQVFVGVPSLGSVSLISDASNSVVNTVRVGQKPGGLAYDSATSQVFVSDQNVANVSVLSDVSDTIVATVPVGDAPGTIAYDFTHDNVYAPDPQTSSFEAVSASAAQVSARLPWSNPPEAAVYDPGKNETFLIEAHGIAVVSDPTNSFAGLMGDIWSPIAGVYDRAKGEIFVSNYLANNVSVYSDSTNLEVASVTVGTYPSALAYDSGRGEVFVLYGANHGGNYYYNISVINDTSDSVVATIPEWMGSVGITYDSGKGELFVPNFNGQNITVISDSTNRIVASINTVLYPACTVYDGGTGTVYFEDPAQAWIGVVSDTSNSVIASMPFGGWGGYSCSGVYAPSDNEVVLTGGGGLLFVNDGNGPSPPLVSSFTASPPALTLGSSTSLSVTATGGVGALSYAYSGLPPGCVSSNATILSCTPTTPGSYGLRVFVNDTGGHSATATTSLAVNAVPTIASIGASPNPTDVGVSVGLAVTGLGGTSPVSYAWHCSEGFASAGQNPVHTFGTAGIPVCRAWYNDSQSYSATKTVTITVGSGPMVTVSANPTPNDVGLPVVLKATGLGGLGPLSYAWRCSDGFRTMTQNTSHAFSSPGALTCVAWYNDSLGASASSSASITVYADPFVATASAAPNPTDAGVQVTLSSSGALGAPPTAQSWRCGDGFTSASPTPLHSFVAPGVLECIVWYNDSLGLSASRSVNVTVSPQPSISGFSALPPTIGIGNATTLTVVATGGTGPIAFAYAGLPLGCASANRASLGCSPTTPGTFTVRVYANDSLGGGATATTALAVSSVPGPSLASVSISPGSDTIHIGGMANFSAILACTGGGACPAGATYSWSISKALGVLGSISASFTSFSAGGLPGVTSLFVNATLHGVTRGGGPAAITITANPVPSLAGVSVAPRSVSVPTGGVAEFSATASCSGGPCPAGLTMAWSLSIPLGTLDATSGPAVRFAAGSVLGSSALLVVASLNGVSRTAVANITVVSPSHAPPGILGLPGAEGYLLVIGVIAAALVLIVLFLFGRRRTRRDGVDPIPPPGSGADASSRATAGAPDAATAVGPSGSGDSPSSSEPEPAPK